MNLAVTGIGGRPFRAQVGSLSAHIPGDPVTYEITFSDGRKAETFEGSYQEALDCARRLAGPYIVIGHDGDLAGGGDRTLFWASEEESQDDDGARALGSIRRRS